MPSEIPDIVISRLPVYLRALERLSQEGQEVTSSHELGRRLGISSAQIRKDLSHFGGFGKQGTGYKIAFLKDQLRSVLKVEREWHVALIGAGDLGSAIARYRGFADRGFHIRWVFDSAPEKVGRKLGPYTILPISNLSETVRANHVKIAMVAVPAEYAQAVTDTLVASGVEAILNYAPINLKVPDNVHVQYIDPVLHLQRMTYYLSE
ncbi:MAG: redox-sensing transcriptional repressor Rex [Pleurocapsa minor GSE-CHR-MK-17-07R]|jgi:redox-sensing transcriptional repressor|nr:redox-sensing transcriptional repressor Rex [Pleurocapsa minor GSE-CHR-MK 17-07R]